MHERQQEERDLAEHARPACPKCGSLDVRRSKGDSLWDTLMHTLGRWPFRCRSCRSRFFLHVPPPPRD